MIPKIIHYCWFGGKEMPKLAKKCIKSWKKYCPDYELKLWNEENFDINSNPYVKEAYENKKFAFVTDYVRLFALYNYGGIYMDTDVEVIKPLDEFLNNYVFLGFESCDFISTGIIASEKQTDILENFLEYYNGKHFINNDGSFELTPNPKIITNILLKKGLILNNQTQKFENILVYPSEYFSPIDWKTKEKEITNNTYTIHWFSGSWISKRLKFKKKIIKMLTTILGKDRLEKLVWFVKRKGRYSK